MLATLRKLAGPSNAPERQALRDAIAAKADAEQQLAAAKERTRRVQAVIDAVDEREREAEQARIAVKAASRAWAVGGAAPDADDAHRQAIAAADQAERRASEAKLLAAGAQDAIPALTQAESEAKYTLEGTGRKVKIAAAEVIYASLGPPLLERLQRISDLIPNILSDFAKLRSIQAMLTRNCSPNAERCRSLLSQVRKLREVSRDEYGLNCSELIEKLERDADAPLEEL